MSIGPLEILILLIIFLSILLISRRQTKRICPKCGFAIRSYTAECPSVGRFFRKRKGRVHEDYVSRYRHIAWCPDDCLSLRCLPIKDSKNHRTRPSIVITLDEGKTSLWIPRRSFGFK